MEKQQVTKFVAGDVVKMSGGEPMTVLEICTQSSYMVLGGYEGDVHCVWWKDGEFYDNYFTPDILQLVRHRTPELLTKGDIVVLASGSIEFAVLDVYEDNFGWTVCLIDPKTQKRYDDFCAHLFDKVSKTK